MLGEIGHFTLAMALGFSGMQALTSFWGVYRKSFKFATLGWVVSFIQGGFLMSAFLTLIIAFFICDFSLMTVVLHDHTSLPWYYRIAATWGNHEGSLLLFILILSGVSVALSFSLKDPLFRARALTIQGFLVFFFLIFLLATSNPFHFFPLPVSEGRSLNPLLQDRGLGIHPPLLYLGYVGFSAVYSLAIATLWAQETGERLMTLFRPWSLFSWGSLTAGITLGSWWAYYELGWGGWWFWDPVENASLMPWLSGTALLHALATKKLYRWSLFLSVLTFNLSLLGTFLVRSGLIVSVHSFAQDPSQGLFILLLLGLIFGFGLFMWVWKSPPLKRPTLDFFSREGMLLLNTLLLSLGLGILLLGTLYPLWMGLIGIDKISVGTPYFDRTFIPLMIPLFLLIPLGSLMRKEKEPLFPLLLFPLTATLGGAFLLLYIFYPLPLLAFVGSVTSLWVLSGSFKALLNKRLTLGPSLAHIGVGLSLLGVSVGGGFRMDENHIVRPSETFQMGSTTFTLQEIQMGKGPNYLYERAILLYPGGRLSPEKRLYKPQNILLSETAIHTNGFRDIYVILGPFQGDDQWLLRTSSIPLAPWIWIGGALMVLGAGISFVMRNKDKERGG